MITIQELERDIIKYETHMREMDFNTDKVFYLLTISDRLKNNLVYNLGGIIKAKERMSELRKVISICPDCRGKGRFVVGQSHDCWGALDFDFKKCKRCAGTGQINKEQEKEERKKRFLELKEEFKNDC